MIPRHIARLVAGGLLVGLAVIMGGPSGLPSARAATTGQAGRDSRHVTEPGRVVVVGVGGLTWQDVSAATTPTMYRLAEHGSIAALSTRTVQSATCPADGWLTLGSGARAMLPRPRSGACAPIPTPTTNGHTARVPGMSAITASNAAYHYDPDFGLLSASVRAAGGCVTSVGPGAALATASASGGVGSYRSSPASAGRSLLARCALSVVDLGSVNGAATPATLRSLDRSVSALAAAMPANSLLVVAGVSDATTSPHLHPLIVSGRAAHGVRFEGGWLVTSSTRDTGLTQITDLTSSVLSWAGTPARHETTTGSLIRSTGGRPADTADAIRQLASDDVANQVFATTNVAFFAVYVVAVLLTLALACVGWSSLRRRGVGGRLLAAVRLVALWLASVPAGSFLANLTVWWRVGHPALVLYLVTAVIALLVAAVPLVARRLARAYAPTGTLVRVLEQPLTPAGFVALVTVAIVGVDVMTGSALQMASPFGLSWLIAGRFYGIGNGALGPYVVCAMFGASWLGVLVLGARRPGHAERVTRMWALAAVVTFGLFTIIACGWPSFGSKFGGTIAVTPGFVALAMIVSGTRITWRRGALVVLSGLLLVSVFAVINWLQPVQDQSHFGDFVTALVHGNAGGILDRKISTNVGSLDNDWISPLIPLLVVLAVFVVVAPRRIGLATVAESFSRVPLLRTTLGLAVLTTAIGWFADDSGTQVPELGLLLSVPLGLTAVISSVSPIRQDRSPAEDATAEDALPSPEADTDEPLMRRQSP